MPIQQKIGAGLKGAQTRNKIQATNAADRSMLETARCGIALEDEQLENITGGVVCKKGDVRQWSNDIKVYSTMAGCNAFVPKDVSKSRVCGNCIYFKAGFLFFVKAKCTYNGNSLDVNDNVDILVKR